MATDRLQGLNIGVAWKPPCYVASTANLTLSSTQVVDGIAVGSCERVLAKDQTDPKLNGVYIADSASWRRAPDWDGSRDAIPGTAVYVDRGSAGGGKAYIANSSATATSIDIASTGDDVTFSLMTLALAGVSAFSQDTLLPLTTAAAWRSSDGLSAAPDPLGSTSISSSAITTALIAGSAVTTVKIADDAVTLAKMSTGVVGNLITYSTLGDPAAVATGSTGQVLTSNGAGLAPTMQEVPSDLTLETEQATTSGTTKDFTGISANAKKITVTLDGVSHNGTSTLELKLGTSGGIEETGYVGKTARITGGTIASGPWATDAIELADSLVATDVVSSVVELTLHDSANNIWMVSGTGEEGGGTSMYLIAGTKPLAGVLDRVRLTSATPDTFDAGSVNILVET